LFLYTQVILTKAIKRIFLQWTFYTRSEIQWSGW